MQWLEGVIGEGLEVGSPPPPAESSGRGLGAKRSEAVGIV